MRITTWNANSVRLREAALRRIMAEIRPDVLCLQETKVEDAFFPVLLVLSLTCLPLLAFPRRSA